MAYRRRSSRRRSSRRRGSSMSGYRASRGGIRL